MYPNPFTTDIKISLPNDAQVQNVSVVNTVGQTVYTAITSDLKLENLPKGLYFLKINTNQGTVSHKIVKN